MNSDNKKSSYTSHEDGNHPNQNKPGNENSSYPDIFIRLDQNGRISFVSESLLSFFQLNSQDLVGKTLPEANIFQNTSEEIIHLISEAIEKGQQLSIEKSLAHDHKSSWISISIFPEKLETGEIQSVNLFIRDITSQKETEFQFAESQKRFNLASEASDNGVWDWNIKEDTLFYTRKWKLQLGYYPDELDNSFSTWMNLLHPEDYHRIKFELDSFLKDTSLVFESEFRMKHKDGTYHWFKCRAAAVRDNFGEAIQMLGTNRDITTEKKNQEELMMLHQAIIQSPAPIIITNLEGHIEFCNPAFCKITGYSPDELIGQKPSILKSGYHDKIFYKKIWSTITTGNEWRGEFKNKKKDGTYYWELASISALRNEWGVITNYLKIAEEITSIKRMEEDLKRAKRQTEDSNVYKNNFLANMSHEIRTPINGIIGFSELLRNGSLSDDQFKRYVGIIVENSHSLLNLIDDIVDISKIEANEIKIKKETCSLPALFSDLEDLFQTLRITKDKMNLEIRFKIPSARHFDHIFTDTNRLKQILSNLFNNALKFTDNGYIEIGYQILSDKKLQFYVEDTGIGIPQNKQKIIFKRHTQQDHSRKDKDGGAGLGLSICKGLVELLGGSIGVRSQVNKGALFYFTLPYDKIKNPVTHQHERPKVGFSFPNRTILIAEDVDYSFEYLKEIITPTGANILWAKDGIDAINLYQKNKIDLILMDIQLPELDGYEATQTIRETNKTIPIIAQTAYAMNEDNIKCLNAGCNEVLIKPLKINEVLNTLAKYLKD